MIRDGFGEFIREIADGVGKVCTIVLPTFVFLVIFFKAGDVIGREFSLPLATFAAGVCYGAMNWIDKWWLK